MKRPSGETEGEKSSPGLDVICTGWDAMTGFTINRKYAATQSHALNFEQMESVMEK